MAESAERTYNVDRMLEQIIDLPEDFHEAGVMSSAALEAIAAHTSGMEVKRSAETGCGKSTLLLSWISKSHTVFTLSHYGNLPCKSYHNVKNSKLLNTDAVNFEIGPSQVSLPTYSFEEPLQVVLIDGPHGFPFPQMEYYYFYPNLQEGGLLIVDDIQIPTIEWLYDFLVDDEMFDLIEIVENTAFFQRTSRPTFNPFGDDWWLQNYNRRRIVQQESGGYLAESIQKLCRRFLSRRKL